MLQSKLFSKTKKEAPKDAEVISHKYLVRGDFIEQSFSGVYRFLPLGLLVLRRIEEVIRKEMIGLGASEIFLPALQNKSLWQETGRWDKIDPPLFKFKDRHQKEIALGSTHEEEITDIFRHRIKSYQDLPLALFQIQSKFRNEMRPTGGLFRTLEFLMKDLYSFHPDEKDLKIFYEKVKKAYFRILEKCGLKSICVEASSGTIGGELSHEFMVPLEAGEDKVLFCPKCGFGANIEKTGEMKNCPKCKAGLEIKNCIELGHIFNLGTKYSQAMGAEYSDRNGKNKPVIMGCYGIGLTRLMAAAVEKNHDLKGIIWPKDIAPFRAHLIQLETGSKVKKAASDLYKELTDGQGFETKVLYDDRDKSAGEKFAESDLIGIPIRIVVSEKTLAKKSAEIKKRGETKMKLVKLGEVKKYI